MKIFDKENLKRRELCGLVEEEVKVHSKLNHPHVVKFLYVAETEVEIILVY